MAETDVEHKNARRDFAARVTGGEIVGWTCGAGPRVLALHGGPGLSYGYLDDMVHELSTGYEVATYQQRGLAPSTTAGPFSIAQEVADACAVMDHLGWERAWVVGHSWGGHLLLHLAFACPERVLGGVAVDTLGATGDGGVEVMSEALERRVSALEAVDRAADQPPDELPTGLRRLWPAYFADPANAPPIPEFQSSKDSSTGIWASINEEMPRLEAGLGGIDVPIIFVAGELSPLSADASSRPTSAAMPKSRLVVVEGAGHFPWFERPGCTKEVLDSLTASDADRAEAEAR